MFETIRQNTPYRSVRYSTIRKDNYTADNSHRLSQFRVKHKAAQESTFYNTRTIDLKPQTAVMSTLQNPQGSTAYMQTFTSMFQSQKRVRQNRQRDNDTFNAFSIKLKFTNFDNSFLKEDGTEFTLLDPFHRPYKYLTSQLSRQEKELKNQKEDLKLIRAQLNLVKRNTLTNLRKCQEEGMNSIQGLRQLLRKNEVESQETKMRTRRQMTQLYQQHDRNVRLKEQLVQRSKGMQRDIFSCQPFQLQIEGQ